MLNDFNSLEREGLLRQLSYLRARLLAIEGMLNGRAYIDIARIATAIVTNAKIGSVGANKITTAQMNVATDLYVGDPNEGGYIHFDAANDRIVLYDDDNARMVISDSIRISLPGYDALTDTNLDHFGLYTDADNILIKEFARGSTTVTTAEQTKLITHGLDYVPMFLVFVYDTVSSTWQLVPHFQSTFVVPPYGATADTTYLYISNFTANTTFVYYIFYDNMVGSSAKTITESENVLKASKLGVNALSSVDPNDYIVHSDLNTFKIIKEGTYPITYSADGTYSLKHYAQMSNPSACLVFIKFPDGYAALIPGNGACNSKDYNFAAYQCSLNTTDISFKLARLGGSGTALVVKYYIFETPLS